MLALRTSWPEHGDFRIAGFRQRRSPLLLVVPAAPTISRFSGSLGRPIRNDQRTSSPSFRAFELGPGRDVTRMRAGCAYVSRRDREDQLPAGVPGLAQLVRASDLGQR